MKLARVRFAVWRDVVSLTCCTEWRRLIRSDAMRRGCRVRSGTDRKRRNGLFSARASWTWNGGRRSRCCSGGTCWRWESSLVRRWERSRASFTRCSWTGACARWTRRSLKLRSSWLCSYVLSALFFLIRVIRVYPWLLLAETVDSSHAPDERFAIDRHDASIAKYSFQGFDRARVVCVTKDRKQYDVVRD